MPCSARPSRHPPRACAPAAWPKPLHFPPPPGAHAAAPTGEVGAAAVQAVALPEPPRLLCPCLPPRSLFPSGEVGVIASHANDRKMAAKSVQDGSLRLYLCVMLHRQPLVCDAGAARWRARGARVGHTPGRGRGSRGVHGARRDGREEPLRHPPGLPPPPPPFLTTPSATVKRTNLWAPLLPCSRHAAGRGALLRLLHPRAGVRRAHPHRRSAQGRGGRCEVCLDGGGEVSWNLLVECLSHDVVAVGWRSACKQTERCNKTESAVPSGRRLSGGRFAWRARPARPSAAARTPVTHARRTPSPPAPCRRQGARAGGCQERCGAGGGCLRARLLGRAQPGGAAQPRGRGADGAAPHAAHAVPRAHPGQQPPVAGGAGVGSETVQLPGVASSAASGAPCCCGGELRRLCRNGINC